MTYQGHIKATAVVRILHSGKHACTCTSLPSNFGSRCRGTDSMLLNAALTSAVSRSAVARNLFHGQANWGVAVSRSAVARNLFRGQANWDVAVSRSAVARNLFHGQANWGVAVSRSAVARNLFHGQANWGMATLLNVALTSAVSRSAVARNLFHGQANWGVANGMWHSVASKMRGHKEIYGLGIGADKFF